MRVPMNSQGGDRYVFFSSAASSTAARASHGPSISDGNITRGKLKCITRVIVAPINRNKSERDRSPRSWLARDSRNNNRGAEEEQNPLIRAARIWLLNWRAQQSLADRPGIVLQRSGSVEGGRRRQWVSCRWTLCGVDDWNPEWNSDLGWIPIVVERELIGVPQLNERISSEWERKCRVILPLNHTFIFASPDERRSPNRPTVNLL